MPRIYFDHNATTPLHPAALTALHTAWTDAWGNPSSPYQEGQRAKALLDHARHTIATHLKARVSEIVFTSGGTESINWVLQRIYTQAKQRMRDERPHFISCTTEHHATLHTLEALHAMGADVTYLPVTASGAIDLNDFEQAIRPTTVLASFMHSNNETGRLHPMAAIAACARKHNILVHCDAVCSMGKVAIDVKALGVHFLSFSGHKFYGPKGIGGLYIEKGLTLPSLHTGGAQEHNRRAGTEAVALASAMAAALTAIHDERDEIATRAIKARRELVCALKRAIPDLRIMSTEDEHDSLPQTLNIVIPGLDAESMVIALDQVGIALSTGSACSSGATDPSHVLLAMGLSKDDAKSALRISFGRDNFIGKSDDNEKRERNLLIENLLKQLPLLTKPRASETA